MAATNSALLMVSQNQETSIDNIIVENSNLPTTSTDNKNNPGCEENLQCFVCDINVQGRHYALATCKTQHSRTRVIEKLGELVGERYMVVISEDDIICRSCANLINTLDRLEMEMRNVRDSVLRFLEQKYALEEGELLGNNEKPKSCQPPQITKCTNQNGVNSKDKDANFSSGVLGKQRNKKTNLWMQCDKCRYTTQHNSFMIHHIRDHIKQKIFCDKCGVQFPGNQQLETHDCNSKHVQNDCKAIKEKGIEEPIRTEELMDVSISEKVVEQQDVPMMSIQAYSHTGISNKDENIGLIQFSNPENLNMQSILSSDCSSTPGQPPMLVRVLQQIDVNDELTQPTIITKTTPETEMILKVKDGTGKQMLTLSEDGSLEMVEIACWNDVQSSGGGITFQ